MERSDGIAGNALAGIALAGNTLAWVAAQLRSTYEPEAFRKGVIAGLLSALPFVLFLLLDEPTLAVFASLAAVRMAMSDPGRSQAFRHRARVLAAGAVCVTAGTFFGTLLAEGPLWTLPLVALLVLAAAYLGALGPDGLATSLTVLLPTTVCLGLPGDPLARSAAVLGSCLFVSALLICAWPLDPDRPARRAAVRALRSVAAMARLLADTGPGPAGSSGPGDTAPGDTAPGNTAPGNTALWAARVRAYRDIDQALAIVADSLPRRREGAAAPALLQLAAAASEARRMTRALTSMAELSAGRPEAGGTADAERQSIAAAASHLDRLANGLGRLPRQTGRHGPAIDLGRDFLPEGAVPPPASPPSGPAEAIRQSLHGICLALSTVGVPAPDDVAAIPMPRPGRTRRLFRWALPLLRDNLSMQSSALRHAVRQAVLVAIATGLVWHFQIAHGYWAMLSIVFVTKPAYGGTRQAAMNRVLATVIGVSAAEMVLLGSHDFWVLAPLALLFNCLSHGVVTVNYLVGYAMLTAYVIFKIEAALPGSDLVVPRLLATMLGCALAAASLAIWPPVSYGGYRRGIRQCLAAQAAVAAALARRVAAGQVPLLVTDPELLPLRRQGRLGLQNAEAVLDEIFDEPGGHHPERLRMRAMVQDLHRLTVLLSALSESGRDLSGHAPDLAAAAETLDRLQAGGGAADMPPAGLLAAPDELLRRYGAVIRDLSRDLSAIDAASRPQTG